MIYITNTAQKFLKHLLYQQQKKKNLRISIFLPGTKNAECKISYDKNQTMNTKDIELKYVYFNIYINKVITPYLKESKIDLMIRGLNEQLMLFAPYAKKNLQTNVEHTIGHINNFGLLNKIQDFITQDINPMLFHHGGKIILVNMTQSRYLKIKFLGGCNGCLMSHKTLKYSIEKKIVQYFPQIKGIIDITNHNRGKHSFY